jgi:hypothetical protein
MSEEVEYFKEKLGNLKGKWVVFGGCFLLLVLVGMGYLAVHRPVILFANTDQSGINIKNGGRIDALIYRIDGFWYWDGQVALLANMPDIRQRVEAGAESLRCAIGFLAFRYSDILPLCTLGMMRLKKHGHQQRAFPRSAGLSERYHLVILARLK